MQPGEPITIARSGQADADGDRYTTAKGDCDDGNPSVHPKAKEVCNGIDDDCDGSIDEGCRFSLTFGGKRDDSALSMVQGNQGGYVIAGQTRSYGAGKGDAWIIQMDESGNKLWYETYGGKGEDSANAVIRGNDGGYIVAGQTRTDGAGHADARIFKIDEDANVLWSRTYGGQNSDWANSICPGNDTGYLMAGQTHSSGRGAWDLWVVKLKNNGQKLWEKTFGGTQSDAALSIARGKNGGYVIAGRTRSYGSGDWDAWVVKIDEKGRMNWYQTFGDKGADTAYAVIQDKDVGYIVAGESRSPDKKSTQGWIIKLAENGNVLWRQNLDNAAAGSAAGVIQDAKGGYIVAGWAKSGTGGKDAWLYKISENGHYQWDRKYGGAAPDAATGIIRGNEGGYVMYGWTNTFGAGGKDAWIIKTDEQGRAPDEPPPLKNN